MEGVSGLMQNAYGIAAPVVSKIKVPSHNKIYKVDAGSAAYAVKVYSDINFTPLKKGSKTAHIHYESAILDRLEQCDVPIIPVCRDGGGRAIHDVGSLKAMVFRYVEGAYFDHSPEQIARSAEVLARVHRCLPLNAVPLNDFDYSAFLAFWLARLDALCKERRFAECIPDGGGILEAARQVRRWHDQANQWPDLVWIHGHGDVNPRNYIYREASAFLFDFQASRRMPRLGDVADGMVEFGIAEAALMPDRMERFLRAYEAVYPLTGIERECLDAFLLADCMIKVVSSLQSDIYFGYKVNMPRMRALLDFCSTLSAPGKPTLHDVAAEAAETVPPR